MNPQALPKMATSSGERLTACPSCQSQSLHPFYSAKGVPGHSCLLMNSYEEALNYPKGELDLAFCNDCGFIFNASFNADIHNYSPNYEETQGYSQVFGKWARGLAQRLVAQYQLSGKTVLEIGCGKGEFLIELCQAGGCQGIGVDPAYVPERNAPGLERNITFIQDFYGPKYADLEADFICCRHTLEHISDTGDFVARLRETIGERLDTLVFFEVPDIYRVLKEGAFWDLYYEHCSYFSSGSQARLFRKCGFDVIDLALEYDSQYILQMAKPSQVQSLTHLELERDLELLRSAVAAFPQVVGRQISHWKAVFEKAAQEGRKTVIWGSGSKGVSLLTTLNLGSSVQYVVDINPHKHGKFMPGSGHRIVSPEFLVEYQPDLVVVMNPIYTTEIRNLLRSLELSPEILAV